MIILGLAGAARSGKDSVADYMVKRYGFLKFSFSDALYGEVAAAFSLVDRNLLRAPETKDYVHGSLRLRSCNDPQFVEVASEYLAVHEQWRDYGGVDEWPMSPRLVLQLWGTEYRRAHNDDYWVDKAQEFVRAVGGMFEYPEQRPQYFVNTSVRFDNEREWVHSVGGNVWHLRRDEVTAVNNHVSERPLSVLEYERELFNNDTLDRLYKGVDMLLSTKARFVRVEPELPYTNEPEPIDGRTTTE